MLSNFLWRWYSEGLEGTSKILEAKKETCEEKVIYIWYNLEVLIFEKSRSVLPISLVHIGKESENQAVR